MMLPHLLAYQWQVDPSVPVDVATDLLMRTLSVTRSVAQDELGLIRDTSARLEWLCVNFSNVTNADTEARIKCAVRAYLFYLVRCTLFSDKSRTRVFISYLRLFEDLGVVSTYGWGTTTLDICIGNFDMLQVGVLTRLLVIYHC